MKSKKQQLKDRRRSRVRALISGTKERPRLSIYRSLRAMYAQAIDDTAGLTLLAVHSREIDPKGKTKTEVAKSLGSLFAERAKEKGIKNVVFDRGCNAYHGRVKAFAEAARAGGMRF